ncbi:alpha/beta hydrolase [Novosphingobium colocasiae]|uniref:alpha/beta hydrolase n=1 Tax=Novosphingobium colocasiae TaxID=1256513 RepID=UPI001671FA78|nr:alpha/beta hydrolase [Novosphingobium colocasiae]
MPDPFGERVFHFANGVTATTDIAFSAIPGFRPLLLDLYRGAGSGPRPLVIYVHGGGWMIGHRRAPMIRNQDFTKVLADLSARGYVVASISYRFSKEAPFPAAQDDVRTAIRFLRANANKYGIDTSRVGIWGASAGAQLAVMEAVNCGKPASGEDQTNLTQTDCVTAAVGWYGPYDFRTWPAKYAPGPRNVYLDCPIGACSDERLAAVSAITYINPKDPPILLITGTEDNTVPDSQSREMAAALQAIDAPVQLEIIPGVGHGWKSPDEAKTIAAMDHAAEVTFRFFDSKLKTR